MTSGLRKERTRAFRIKVYSIIFFLVIFFRLYLDMVDFKISIPILDPIAFSIREIIKVIFSIFSSLFGG